MNHGNMTEDRLSDLPQEVIHAILTRMPLRNAARTSILSRDWRYKWSDLPGIVLRKVHYPLGENESLDSREEYDRKLVRIIDQVLLLHRGPVYKFWLSIPFKSCTGIERWFLFLSRNGIREVTLRKWDFGMYEIPSSMFSCTEITYLELDRCRLIPPASFNGFSKLKTLHLWTVKFSNNEGLENLISNCPLLSKLVLKRIKGCTKLKISAPNLVEFIFHSVFIDLCFEETPVLANVTMNLLLKDGQYQRSASGSVCKLMSILCCLPSIRRLHLLDRTYQFLTASGDALVRLRTRCQLSYLSASINFDDMQEMTMALCIFKSSSLHKIDIKSYSDENEVGLSVEDFWGGKKGVNCLFTELRVLRVTEFTGTAAELRFVERVLANAPVLQIAEIRFKDNLAEVLNIVKKLSRFRRKSSKAELVFPE